MPFFKEASKNRELWPIMRTVILSQCHLGRGALTKMNIFLPRFVTFDYTLALKVAVPVMHRFNL